ncbi:microfibril-associated glycoprotein 4-like [Patiria miniata]|uniref:Fibrinogen C-terminal domain-containing protein n=1 Tax=Patiria miniata TaxID=46514 RepID=A0A914AQT5_PATMI|nr:microfibril-associated glycoprotein 4-like [Patiria miniata]
MSLFKCWGVPAVLSQGACFCTFVVLFLSVLQFPTPSSAHLRSASATATFGQVPAHNSLAVFRGISPEKCFANCLSHPLCVSWSYMDEVLQGSGSTVTVCSLYDFPSNSSTETQHDLNEDSVSYDIQRFEETSHFGISPCSSKLETPGLEVHEEYDATYSGDNSDLTFRDCNDIDAYYKGQDEVNTISMIQPIGFEEPLEVLCFGPWIAIQIRLNAREEFNRSWDDYKHGFGGPSQGNLWLGNENLHKLTSSGSWALGVVLQDWDGESRSCTYFNFNISDEAEGYRLYADGYSFDSDEGPGDALKAHSGMQFSTQDRDNDLSNANCAKLYSGGWWFKDCLNSNLNGKYLGKVNQTLVASKGQGQGHGIVWSTWKGRDYSLQYSWMMITKLQEELFT